VLGHEAVTAAFARAVQRDRLAHAYLFVGPEGVGKRLFGLELAKAVLCEDAAGQFGACDHCRACLQVEARSHPDFQSAELPEDRHEFPVALMQEMIRNLALKPARGAYRVALLDDADYLNEEAANCFLKTLEEPPPRSLLILIGTTVDRQLPTIVSRCQVIRFAPLQADLVAAHLIQQGLVADPQEARRLAQLSNGSLGEARALVDADLWPLRRQLLDGLTQTSVDSVGLAGLVVRFVEEEQKESAIRRQRAALVLRFLVEFLRGAILLQHGQKLVLLDSAEIEYARRLADRIPLDALVQALDRCLEAGHEIDRRVQLVLVLEALLDALGQRLQVHKAS
jgi:DNA polymerase-3 subunit delta'